MTTRRAAESALLHPFCLLLLLFLLLLLILLRLVSNFMVRLRWQASWRQEREKEKEKTLELAAFAAHPLVPSGTNLALTLSYAWSRTHPLSLREQAKVDGVSPRTEQDWSGRRGHEQRRNS